MQIILQKFYRSFPYFKFDNLAFFKPANDKKIAYFYFWVNLATLLQDLSMNNQHGTLIRFQISMRCLSSTYLPLQNNNGEERVIQMRGSLSHLASLNDVMHTYIVYIYCFLAVVLNLF